MPDWFMEAFPDSQIGPGEWAVPISQWDNDLFWKIASHVVERYPVEWIRANHNFGDEVVVITIGADPVVAEPAIP